MSKLFMLACISAIKSAKDEKQALSVLNRRWKSLTNLSLTTSTQRSETTLLIEATKRGFLSVVKFHHAKGCDVNEENEKKQTALMIACLTQQEAIADFLLKHTTNVEGDLYRQTPMHYFAQMPMPMPELVKRLHQKYPKLIHQQDKTGETPLMMAAKKGNLWFIEFCLAHGVDVNESDIFGITPYLSAFSRGQFGAMQVLLHFPNLQVFHPDGLEAQRQLHQDFLKESSIQNKIGCLSLLFATGGGLELSHIPDECFTLFKVERSQLKEFLIVGEELDIASKVYKKKLITSCAQLENLLQNPNWRFQTELLAVACQYPGVASLPHVQRLRSLLKVADKPLSQLKSPWQDTDLSVHGIQALSPLALKDRLVIECRMLKQFAATISYKLADLRRQAIANEAVVLPFPSFDRELNNYLTCLESLVALSHHEVLPKIKIANHAALSQPFVNFGEVFSIFMTFFKDDHQSDFSLKYVSLIEDKIRKIISAHGKAIKKPHLSFFNSLMDAQAYLCQLMARQHLAYGELDVALSLSVEGMKYCERIVVDNPNLEENTQHIKALCLTTMSEVFYSHGWIGKAANYTRKAFECNQKAGMLFDPLLISQAEKLAVSFYERNKKFKSIELLQKAKLALDLILPFFVTPEISAKKLAITEKLLSQESAFFEERVKQTYLLLDGLAILKTDGHQRLIVRFEPKFNDVVTGFLVNNSTFGELDQDQLVLAKESIFSNLYLGQLKKLCSLLKKIQEIEFSDLIEELETLQLNYNQESSQISPREEDIISFGFKKIPGFTPIIPLYSQYLPKETLFITMPEDSPAFEPFYKLIRNGHSQQFSPVKAIPAGPNQQGVKLGTQIQSDGTKVAFGRLKVLGAQGTGKLRARGYVEQTVIGDDRKVRKLYVFREVLEKKKEERSHYKV